MCFQVNNHVSKLIMFPSYVSKLTITSVSGVKQMGSKVSPNIRIFSLSQFMKYLSPNVNSESRHIVQLLKQLACNGHPVWLSKVNGQPYNFFHDFNKDFARRNINHKFIIAAFHKIIKMGNFEIDSEDFLAYWRVEMLYAMINLNSGLILKLKCLTLILNGYKSCSK